jgi:hypothetical protein
LFFHCPIFCLLNDHVLTNGNHKVSFIVVILISWANQKWSFLIWCILGSFKSNIYLPTSFFKNHYQSFFCYLPPRKRFPSLRLIMKVYKDESRKWLLKLPLCYQDMKGKIGSIDYFLETQNRFVPTLMCFQS